MINNYAHSVKDILANKGLVIRLTFSLPDVIQR